jgi:hypothetical protein
VPVWCWHSSHESANGKYSFFPARFKVFLALFPQECQWASLRSASMGPDRARPVAGWLPAVPRRRAIRITRHARDFISGLTS